VFHCPLNSPSGIFLAPFYKNAFTPYGNAFLKASALVLAIFKQFSLLHALAYAALKRT
jgi:hypothetical protein